MVFDVNSLEPARLYSKQRFHLTPSNRIFSPSYSDLDSVAFIDFAEPPSGDLALSAQRKFSSQSKLFSEWETDRPFSMVGPPVGRSNFQITNAAVFFGVINSTNGTTDAVVKDWNFDTLIVSSRRSYNGIARDTPWESNSLQNLKLSSSQDVFFYLNVGKVDRDLDAFTGLTAGADWLGADISRTSTNFANFWLPSWFEKLKGEVNKAIDAGADGIFLDDLGVHYDLSVRNLSPGESPSPFAVAGRSLGPNALAMMQLVLNLSNYARASNKGGSEFRIMVNSAPFIRGNAIFGKDGDVQNERVFHEYRNAIDGLIFENPFEGDVIQRAALDTFRSEFGAFGKQVILIDSMKLIGETDIRDGPAELARVSAEYGFVPLLAAQDTTPDVTPNSPPKINPDKLSYFTVPARTGIASNRPSANADILIGSPISDTLDGGLGNDSIYGHLGNDILTGGSGNDILDGGAGFDFASYDRSDVGVTVFMNGGLANSGEARGDTHSSVEGLIGSGFSDVLGGDNQANLLQGYGGNDWLLGVQGTDTLQGGDGNDVLSGGLGADFLDGGNGLDVAYYRDAGAIVIASLAAGGTGGEAAGDTYFGVENIWGSTFGDNLTGDDNAGQIYGFEGNDTLSGLGGDDFFYGGAGGDSLTGGLGIDSFFMLAWRDQVNIFGTTERAEGGDTFTDFTSGTDRIILSRFWFGFGNIGGPAAALTETHANFVTNGVVGTTRPSLIWNAGARTLSFDADGVGATQAVLLGTVQAGATLTLGDIWTA